MIGEIGSLGQASRRDGLSAAFLYTVGAVAGALLLGFALGTLGRVIRWVFYLDTGHYETIALAMAIPAIVGGLWDLGIIPLPLPGPTKQLPRHWFAILGSRRTSFLWGLHVGLGQKTRVVSALYYVLTLWIVVRGSPVFGASLLGVYALSHGFLLASEIAAISWGSVDPIHGLMGLDRALFLFRYAGIALLICGVFLLAQPWMLP
jgi:hypothetical protein